MDTKMSIDVTYVDKENESENAKVEEAPKKEEIKAKEANQTGNEATAANGASLK